MPYDGDRSVREPVAGGALGERWTLEEAARRLDPPVSVEQLRAMVHLAGLRPVGRRRMGLGRFRFVYDARQICDAHAQVAPLLGVWEAGPGVRYYRTAEPA